MYRKITDYFSMFLLMPILIVISGGLSIFMSTSLKYIEDFVLLAPILKFLIRLIPFVLTWFMFTGLYIYMPNTKVRFKPALISGILQERHTRHSSFSISVVSYGYRAIMPFMVALPHSLCFCFGFRYHGPSACLVQS